jgi:hypothetical protein
MDCLLAAKRAEPSEPARLTGFSKDRAMRLEDIRQGIDGIE